MEAFTKALIEAEVRGALAQMRQEIELEDDDFHHDSMIDALDKIMAIIARPDNK